MSRGVSYGRLALKLRLAACLCRREGLLQRWGVILLDRSATKLACDTLRWRKKVGAAEWFKMVEQRSVPLLAGDRDAYRHWLMTGQVVEPGELEA